MAGVTREAGNAHSSGTPGSISFARSSQVYRVFTGLVFVFYIYCLSNDVWQRLSILDLSAGTFIITNKHRCIIVTVLVWSIQAAILPSGHKIIEIIVASPVILARRVSESPECFRCRRSCQCIVEVIRQYLVTGAVIVVILTVLQRCLINCLQETDGRSI